jgi:methylated-DNA-protein-cysteine methyltransferase related protein
LRQHDAILAAVAAIPRGRVATYGQVACLAGLPGRARLVGRVLRLLPDDSAVPWHRVVNARGGISLREPAAAAREQRRLLREEGIRFGRDGRIALARFGLDEEGSEGADRV